MPAAAAAPPPDDDAASPWNDLPLDLVGDIAGRLHAATDYVRFHSASQPWRDTLPPPPCRRPAFLPWLLAPRDASGQRKARCVFSSRSSRRTAAATEICVRDRRWVVSADDGTAACWIAGAPCPDPESRSLGDPLTGSAAAIPLPRCQDEMKTWEKRAVGVISGDGTIIVYAYGRVRTPYYMGDSFHVALLHPGDKAWTFLQMNGVYIYGDDRDHCCVAYRNGRIVLCAGSSWTLLPAQAKAAAEGGSQMRWMPREPGKRYESSYLMESRGELLWVFVQVNTAYYTDIEQHGIGVVNSLTAALSVSVYTLKEEQGGEPQWEKKDYQSLEDCVMFLGRPRSFAMDAGVSGGGCAYFLDKRRVYGGIWSKAALERCRLFRYSFKDSKSELVEQLPEDWSDTDCMWLTPQPALSTTEEIRRRLDTLNRKATGPHGQFGPYFRIYVGNLPRKVDSYQLRQFFSKHGKVADARIMCNKGTGRSRGFGFVTMATQIGDEPADAIARLHGQSLDGRTLRVKFADQEG